MPVKQILFREHQCEHELWDTRWGLTGPWMMVVELDQNGKRFVSSQFVIGENLDTLEKILEEWLALVRKKNLEFHPPEHHEYEGKHSDQFFHSACCNAHMEGKVEGTKLLLVCENCGEYVGDIDNQSIQGRPPEVPAEKGLPISVFLSPQDLQGAAQRLHTLALSAKEDTKFVETKAGGVRFVFDIEGGPEKWQKTK